MSSASPSWAQQPAVWFTTVSPRVLNLLQQLTLRPRWRASRVPLLEHRNGFVVRKVEASHDPATDSERPKISVLTRYRGLDRYEKPTGAAHAIVKRADSS